MSVNKVLLAVSGGVDSVVMLDKVLFNQEGMNHLFNGCQVAVAHFNHNMRMSSGADARFVEGLSKKLEVEFIGGVAKKKLNSEVEARDARWEFLRFAQQQTKSTAIATAHHQDDVYETMIINILRGTGYRGLISLNENDQVLRPMLSMTKQTIYDYATNQRLEFVEDESNWSDDFLRNRIRRYVMPIMDTSQKQKLFDIRERLECIDEDLNQLLRGLMDAIITVDNTLLDRREFIMLPLSVQRALIHQWLSGVGIVVNRRLVDEIVVAVSTAQPGRVTVISNKVHLCHNPRHSKLIEV